MIRYSTLMFIIASSFFATIYVAFFPMPKFPGPKVPMELILNTVSRMGLTPKAETVRCSEMRKRSYFVKISRDRILLLTFDTDRYSSLMGPIQPPIRGEYYLDSVLVVKISPDSEFYFPR